MEWENVLQQCLVMYNYNTFGSYVDFYKSYQKSNQNLIDFVLNYQPLITDESMSCVALSLYLMKQLQQVDKQVGSMFSLVSCEEMIPADVDSTESLYQMNCTTNVKEHVLVCLKFSLAEGHRRGYVILDPGYHVSRPIVVMSDTAYPHTGWFVASNNGRSVKEHHLSYQLSDQLVVWKVRESSQGQLAKEYVNVIFVQKQFTNYAHTEKRSHIFLFKSFVIRSRKGAIAGFYSRIDLKNLTIFFPSEENATRVSHRFSIEDIHKPEVRAALCKVVAMEQNADCLQERVNSLLQMLFDFRTSLNDSNFCLDLCELDKWIDAD